MIRLLYNLVWPIGLFFFLPGYLVKMFRRGGYRAKFGQRLAIYDRGLVKKLQEQQNTWFHAVSVGEVSIALKLADELRRLEPNLKSVLTTTTTTGFSVASARAPDWTTVVYMPLDFWPVMRRAFSVLNPSRIILVEAEVWPNLTARARARRVPIALVNARLSPRSEARFLQFRRFIAPMFRKLNLIAVPERRDVERWVALGADRATIRHTGSIKYDPGGQPKERQESERLIFDSGDPVVFGGSTHRGEEEVLGHVFVRLRPTFPSLHLFIAPRHVERVREIQSRLENLGLSVGLVSQLAVDGSRPPDCILLDRTGELQQWYATATVAFVGKSLTARGGQNPVEPVVAGVPVLFGPHMENFQTLADELVKKKGAVQVPDADSLEREIRSLLLDDDARQVLVANAEKVVSEHRGATQRTAQLIHHLRVER